MVTRRETGYRGLVAVGAVLVVVVLSSCGRNHAEEPAPAQPLPVTTKTAAFDGGIVAVTTIGLPPDLAARGIDAIATCPAAAFWFSAATLDVVTCGSPSVVRSVSATGNTVDLVITPDTNGSDGSVAAIGLVLNTRVTLPPTVDASRPLNVALKGSNVAYLPPPG